MRYLVVGDLHFKRTNLDLMRLLEAELLQLIRTHQPDQVVLLGDTLDTHERVHLLALAAANRFLSQVGQLAPTILLIGNHDRVNNSDFQSGIHPFVGVTSPGTAVTAVKVIERAEILTLDGVRVAYVPYVPPGRFREALQTAGWTSDGPQPQLCFAHQEFRGAADGAHVSEAGDVCDYSFPIYSGHYHGYQRLPGVVYVGTPIQHRYGESPDNAVMLLTVTDDQIDEIRLPISSVPKRWTLSWTLTELEAYRLGQLSLPSGLVRVDLSVPEDQAKALVQSPLYRQLTAQVDSVRVKVQAVTIPLAQQLLAQSSLLEPTMSLRQLVESMLDPSGRELLQQLMT